MHMVEWQVGVLGVLAAIILAGGWDAIFGTLKKFFSRITFSR